MPATAHTSHCLQRPAGPACACSAARVPPGNGIRLLVIHRPPPIASTMMQTRRGRMPKSCGLDENPEGKLLKEAEAARAVQHEFAGLLARFRPPRTGARRPSLTSLSARVRCTEAAGRAQQSAPAQRRRIVRTAVAGISSSKRTVSLASFPICAESARRIGQLRRDSRSPRLSARRGRFGRCLAPLRRPQPAAKRSAVLPFSAVGRVRKTTSVCRSAGRRPADHASEPDQRNRGAIRRPRSRRYLDSTQSPGELGRELRADVVLCGSVRDRRRRCG